ncbi:class III cytochrome C family protein [Desulfosoma caldarium]|uniref:Class III cytochrome C family protein n=2 Tax=Desulfosoma caldarium TaxID=610254 RepID=A0A3N1UQT5_9BACT|nr:class III cytochrome C family protein [Desulfosoma caldarium]
MGEVKKSASQRGVGMIAFLAGFIGALLVGWVVFPNVLYSTKTQPITFLHSSHQDSDCQDCHFFREDGSYNGLPKLETCAECHEEPMGESPEEQKLVEEYIQQEREIPWLVYAWQPDNVYFSHAAHTETQGIECVRCHRDVTKETKNPPFKENRLTGYSDKTMKMVECEKCHAERGVSNACHVCHK